MMVVMVAMEFAPEMRPILLMAEPDVDHRRSANDRGRDDYWRGRADGGWIHVDRSGLNIDRRSGDHYPGSREGDADVEPNARLRRGNGTE